MDTAETLKPVAEETAEKKPAKKTAAKKPAAKKTAAKKSSAKKPSARKTAAAAKKTVKKAPAKKPAVKKTAVKEAPAEAAEAPKKTVKKPAAKTAAGKQKYRLVIVESPTKAHTISQFLGKGYKVEPSNGHIRDLPKSQLGVDIENDFEPKYITIRGRGDVLAKIRQEAKDASSILLATDPDREGEAIAWHLSEVLGIDPASTCRVEFNEITKNTVKNAVTRPRTINMELVDAQQTRRVLDRLVGYKISPLLWAKVRKGLSAGRVQSVATRMVVDREDEIEAFVPEEYWYADARLKGAACEYTARLALLDGQKAGLACAGDAEAAKARIEKASLSVHSVKRGERRRHPAPPFTTSNLQQEAGRKLNFTTAKTMQIAQQLFEGVEIPGRGTMGLISYIRTDSVRLSDEAVQAARELISSAYGGQFVPEKPNVFKGRSSAQDAHEAIRPADASIRPETVKEALSRDQYRLYQLIWQRFIACQMSDAVYETQAVDIADADESIVLRANGVKLLFKGFTAVYEEGKDESDEDRQPEEPLIDAQEGENAEVLDVQTSQHFTQPPAHYTEASLVRALEEKGIGRPSTYAPTISTIISRGYILRKARHLFPTELGRMVTSMMKENFPEIVDIRFTAGMENRLDEVEEGRIPWKKVIRDFYGPFSKTLEAAESRIDKVEVKDEVSDVVCDKCGAMMVYKQGRFGRFLACPNFPACRNTKNIRVTLDVPCPKCGGEIVEKTTHHGRRFYGCANYPECDFTSWERPSAERCPKCGGWMTEKRGAKGETILLCRTEGCGEKVVKAAPQEPEED